MKQETREQIALLLREMIQKKMSRYSPETEHKPFFEAIFTTKQIHTAALIQSFYTSFGMSFYEQLAVAVAKVAGYTAENQYILKGSIDTDTEALIEQMHVELKRGKNSNWKEEVNKIRKSIKKKDQI